MNKKDREVVKEAIECLMDEDGDYARGIGILCELVGWRYPAYHNTKDLKSVRIEDIVLGPGKFPGIDNEDQ